VLSLTSSKSEDQVEGGFLLDIVVREGPSVFQLLSSEDESLLIGRDTFLVLDLSLDVLNGVRWLHIQGDGLSSEGLHKDLHSTSQSQDQMESGLLLDVVVGESPSVFQLLSSEDESLLIGGDSLLVLDLGLDIFNGVRWLNVKSDGLSSQSLDEDLHASSESEHQVKGLIPSGCCSQKGSCRLQVASRRR